MSSGHAKPYDLTDYLGRLGCPAPAELHEQLRRDHARPTTPYHCWTHISHGLDLLWEYRGRIPDFDAVVLAWLNHDRIYDPHSKDNEEASAKLARALCLELGLGHLADQVQGLVLDTAHRTAPKSPAGEWLVGVDLAILGETPEIFAQFEANIRREYAHVPDELYRAGRRKILESFLNRDRLYAVPELYERFEAAARKNLTQALQNL